MFFSLFFPLALARSFHLPYLSLSLFSLLAILVVWWLEASFAISLALVSVSNSC
jgi:hypothetical protein